MMIKKKGLSSGFLRGEERDAGVKQDLIIQTETTRLSFCEYQALPLVSHPTSLPFKQAQALPPLGWAGECWAWCLGFGVRPKCAFQLCPSPAL